MAKSDTNESTPTPSAKVVAEATSELNNLLQIIAGSSSVLDRVAEGDLEATQYLEMLRSSIDRVEALGLRLARQSGGAEPKTIQRSPIAGFLKNKDRAGAAAARQTIMVVDDEQMALTMISRILKEAGYEVAQALSGFECVDLFRQHPNRFALILLDFSLPFMDGEETFKRLREIRNDIPVVLCTGFILKERLKGMMSAGLTGFLRKPVPADELVSVVRSTLQMALYSREASYPTGMPLAG